MLCMCGDQRAARPTAGRARGVLSVARGGFRFRAAQAILGQPDWLTKVATATGRLTATDWRRVLMRSISCMTAGKRSGSLGPHGDGFRYAQPVLQLLDLAGRLPELLARSSRLLDRPDPAPTASPLAGLRGAILGVACVLGGCWSCFSRTPGCAGRRVAAGGVLVLWAGRVGRSADAAGGFLFGPMETGAVRIGGPSDRGGIDHRPLFRLTTRCKSLVSKNTCRRSVGEDTKPKCS